MGSQPQPQTQWSSWSSCSSSCGGGVQTRSNNAGQTERRGCSNSPCPTDPPLTWSRWSSCSASCGGGSMRRTRSDGRIENQDCNFNACPKPQSSTFDNEDTETWLIGGDNTGGSIERLIETSNGNVFSSIITKFPNGYPNPVAGYLDGKVYVCGGNSGTDSTGQYRVHNPCYSAFPSQPRSWNQAPSMITNTTNAAYAVHKTTYMYLEAIRNQPVEQGLEFRFSHQVETLGHRVQEMILLLSLEPINVQLQQGIRSLLLEGGIHGSIIQVLLLVKRIWAVMNSVQLIES